MTTLHSEVSWTQNGFASSTAGPKSYCFGGQITEVFRNEKAGHEKLFTYTWSSPAAMESMGGIVNVCPFALTRVSSLSAPEMEAFISRAHREVWFMATSC